MYKNSALLIAGIFVTMVGSSPASAACPVPNTLTNGQVADATQVMGNFNALGNCSVSTTGSPASGSLPVFTGAKTIGSGNLTGDVTTSGGTATTLASSGVTPGSYSGANITVDAKGRVTAASSGTGPGSGGLQLIGTYQGNGTSPVINITNIPPIYRDLEVRIVGRTTASAAAGMSIILNAINTNIYDLQREYALGTTRNADQYLAATSWALAFALPGTSHAAGFVSGGEFVIQGYTKTNLFKLFRAHARHSASATDGSAYSVVSIGQSRTLAVISSITLTMAAGNFAAETEVEVYGRGNAS
ncbi:MAG: hypothetical protein H0W74_04945 [Sphingosinicella sp.]|nr:hypothetical protein [Sphingosinicella sp.]